MKKATTTQKGILSPLKDVCLFIEENYPLYKESQRIKDYIAMEQEIVQDVSKGIDTEKKEQHQDSMLLSIYKKSILNFMKKQKEGIFPAEKTVFLNVSDTAEELFNNGHFELYSVNREEQTERLIESLEQLDEEAENFPICIQVEKKDCIIFDNKQEAQEAVEQQKPECYIDYLDSKNKFRETRKEFNTYEEALKFMIDTFDTVNTDLIKYF